MSQDPFMIAGQVLGAAGEMYRQGQVSSRNAADRNFIREQYRTQRNDMLKDWERTNAYNHPKEQMNRLRQAGLNANLVYGKGAANTADMLRSPDMKQHTPELDLVDTERAMSPMLKYVSVKKAQAETDNIAAQNAVLRADAILKAAQTAKTLSEGKRSKFDLDLANELKQSVIERAQLENERTRLSNEKTKVDTQINLDRNQRDQLKNSTDVRYTLQKILESKQQVLESQARAAKTEQERKNLLIKADEMKHNINLLQDKELFNMYDLKLREMGIMPSDGIWHRKIIEDIHNAYGEDKHYGKRQGSPLNK